jgi:hypothetical protein
MSEEMKMRTGLRICGQRGDPEVKEALLRFARWVRTQYEFPVRLPVYLRPELALTSLSGNTCVSTFFRPDDLKVEPYIRIATGDYVDEKSMRGRDNALLAYLNSLAFQLVNYFDWIEERERSSRQVRRQADKLIDSYADCVDHP